MIKSTIVGRGECFHLEESALQVRILIDPESKRKILGTKIIVSGFPFPEKMQR